MEHIRDIFKKAAEDVRSLTLEELIRIQDIVEAVLDDKADETPCLGCEDFDPADATLAEDGIPVCGECMGSQIRGYGDAVDRAYSASIDLKQEVCDNS